MPPRKNAAAKPPAAVGAPWRSRIVGYGKKPPDQFTAHPLNWRTHPPEQMEALAAVLREVGVVQTVIENVRTGNLVDGHARVILALRDGVPELDYVKIDVAPEEEAKILATLDPIGALAGADPRILKDLADLVATDEPAINALLQDLVAKFDVDALPGADGPDDLENMPDELEGVGALKPDMQFPSTLPWDIPELRPDRLAEIPPGLKTWAGPDATRDDGAGWWLYNWGSDSIRGLPLDRTVLAFYTDDYRFDRFFTEPHRYVAKVLRAGIRTALSPNFSLWVGQSRAIHLFNTFRSRWVGRYLQEAGLRLIPDVNWADQESFDYCLLGLPKAAPALALQLQTLRDDDEKDRAVAGVKTVLDRLQPNSLLVYGGPAAEPVLEKAGVTIPVTLLENRVALRRSIMEKRRST